MDSEEAEKLKIGTKVRTTRAYGAFQVRGFVAKHVEEHGYTYMNDDRIRVHLVGGGSLYFDPEEIELDG